MNIRNIVKQQQAFKHWGTSLIDSPPSSFINDELRPYTMQLHAKNQAKEGQQPAEPVSMNFISILSIHFLTFYSIIIYKIS